MKTERNKITQNYDSMCETVQNTFIILMLGKELIHTIILPGVIMTYVYCALRDVI